MPLSYDLLSQFAKVVNQDKKTNSESTAYGKVVVDENGAKYVQLDGSDQLTPLGDSSADVNADERVSVLIKNHTATVTGNISSPAARTGDVQNLGDQVTDIQKFDILIGQKIQIQEGYIQDLQADVAEVGELKAAVIEVTELVADKATVEELNAAKAEITDLVATKIDAEVVESKYATIENLEATTVKVGTLEAAHAEFKDATVDDLDAIHAQIDDLDVEHLDAKYVNIDFSNIDKAWMEEFYATSGLIDYVVTEDLTSTGYLVGVTIKGDVIEGGTIVADKLVIKDSRDGLYYKLNISGESVETEQTEYNSLNGSIITAKSITAEKLRVTDLVAFGATIGGFRITDNSLYSGVKSTVDNTTRGVYLDNDGQFALGDSNNFLRYYYNSSAATTMSDGVLTVTDNDDASYSAMLVYTDNGNIVLVSGGVDPDVSIVNNTLLVREGSYKLEISAESILFGANSKKSVADLKALSDYVKIETVVDEETGEEKPCIELSEENSTHKQVITNVKTILKDGETVKTEVGADGIKTTDLIVNGSITHGGFVWAFRANGNYGLSWKEVTS